MLLNAYRTIQFDARSPSHFVKMAVVAVFGIEKLINSTVTGQGSNRNKKSKTPVYKLDENKLLAVRGQLQLMRKFRMDRCN